MAQNGVRSMLDMLPPEQALYPPATGDFMLPGAVYIIGLSRRLCLGFAVSSRVALLFYAKTDNEGINYWKRSSMLDIFRSDRCPDLLFLLRLACPGRVSPQAVEDVHRDVKTRIMVHSLTLRSGDGRRPDGDLGVVLALPIPDPSAALGIHFPPCTQVDRAYVFALVRTIEERGLLHVMDRDVLRSEVENTRREAEEQRRGGELGFVYRTSRCCW